MAGGLVYKLNIQYLRPCSFIQLTLDFLGPIASEIVKKFHHFIRIISMGYLFFFVRS